MSDCIICILYYILAYIQHDGDMSLEQKIEVSDDTFTGLRLATDITERLRKSVIVQRNEYK